MVHSFRASRRLSAPVLALAAAALFAPASAGAAATKQDAAAVRAYWTPERMASALPGSDLLASVPVAGPLDGVLGLGGGSQSTAPRAVHATRVQNPSKKPYRKHGKVFFTSGLSDYVCSGTSAKAKTKSLVITAGHCTYDESNGQQVTNFEFVPAYDHGDAPFGKWAATKLESTPGWKNSQDIRYDVGMATVGKLHGKKLGNVVGSRKVAFNQGRNLHFDVFGYPAADPYDGKSMYLCDTEANGTDHGQGDPEPTRISCDQTGGSSGGGWILPNGRLNSVVSYGYECTLPIDPICDNSEKGNLFGPYFGNEIRKLYRSQKR